MPKCLVNRCLTRWGRKNEQNTLHSFSTDIDLAKIWLRLIGYNEPCIEALIPKIMDRKTRGRYHICSKHFEKNCYERNRSGLSLKKGSIPTLYLSSDTPSDPKTEHDYAKPSTNATQMQSMQQEQENGNISDERPGNLCSLQCPTSPIENEFSNSIEEPSTEICEVEIVHTETPPTAVSYTPVQETTQDPPRKRRRKKHTRNVSTST